MLNTSSVRIPNKLLSRGSILGVYEQNGFSRKHNWRKENPMRVDKRGLLKAFLRREDLCKKLSPHDIRLFLLLVVSSEKGKREGKLSWENVKEYLGDNFGKDRLKRTASRLEKMGLAKVTFHPGGTHIAFQLL